MKAKKRYRIITKKKSRIITCYANNQSGEKLKKEHLKENIILNEIYTGFNNESSFSYQKNKNCRQLIEVHYKNNYFLKLDIQSFFPSINHNILKKILLKSGKLSKNEITKIIKTSSSHNKGLDIGMIPSGTLSNIYLSEFDTIIKEKLPDNCTYSRYADDIIISSKEKLNNYLIKQLIVMELSKYKLQINPSKINEKALLKHKDHIKILGINIVKGNEKNKSKNYITISRKFKKKMKKEKNIRAKNSMEGYINYNEKI